MKSASTLHAKAISSRSFSLMKGMESLVLGTLMPLLDEIVPPLMTVQ